MTSYGIGYEHIKSFISWLSPGIICSSFYIIKKRYYGVTSLSKDKKKTCAYVIVKFVNYKKSNLTYSN